MKQSASLSIRIASIKLKRKENNLYELNCYMVDLLKMFHPFGEPFFLCAGHNFEFSFNNSGLNNATNKYTNFVFISLYFREVYC